MSLAIGGPSLLINQLSFCQFSYCLWGEVLIRSRHQHFRNTRPASTSPVFFVLLALFSLPCAAIKYHNLSLVGEDFWCSLRALFLPQGQTVVLCISWSFHLGIHSDFRLGWWELQAESVLCIHRSRVCRVNQLQTKILKGGSCVYTDHVQIVQTVS